MSRLLLWAVLASVAVAVLGEVATLLPCPVDAKKCAVSEVRITPCTNPKRCALKRGKDAGISFDYTPQFAASKMKHQVSTTAGAVLDGLDEEACKFTSCPAQSGQKQTLNYNLHVSKLWPKTNFDIVWKLWNEEDASDLCCFTTRIRLH